MELQKPWVWKWKCLRHDLWTVNFSLSPGLWGGKYLIICWLSAYEQPNKDSKANSTWPDWKCFYFNKYPRSVTKYIAMGKCLLQKIINNHLHALINDKAQPLKHNPRNRIGFNRNVCVFSVGFSFSLWCSNKYPGSWKANPSKLQILLESHVCSSKYLNWQHDLGNSCQVSVIFLHK